MHETTAEPEERLIDIDGGGERFSQRSNDEKSVTSPFWFLCISPYVVLLYANHRLENIMSGPNLAETKQYKDQGVDGYYDTSLLGNYNTRYNLFIFAVIFIGLIAIVVPFVII